MLKATPGSDLHEAVRADTVFNTDEEQFIAATMLRTCRRVKRQFPGILKKGMAIEAASVAGGVDDVEVEQKMEVRLQCSPGVPVPGVEAEQIA